MNDTPDKKVMNDKLVDRPCVFCRKENSAPWCGPCGDRRGYPEVDRLKELSEENARLRTKLAKANGSLRAIDILVKDGAKNLYDQVMPIVRIVYETLEETRLHA